MRSSFPIRLMSLVVYSPIMLALFSLLYMMFFMVPLEHQSHYQSHYFWCGLSIEQWSWIALGVCPVLAGLLLLWKGTLRIGFVLMVTPALLCLPVSSLFPPKGSLAPEKRIITIDKDHYNFRGAPEGTDVYCNGVLLGQTPLKIAVGELTQKVEPWTTPPPQKWLDVKPRKFYSWFPWDGFLRERWDAHVDHNVEWNIPKCRYWWRLEFQGAELCCCDTGYNAVGSYDEIVEYGTLTYRTLLAPSVIPHADLLLDVYPRLDEADKKLWAEYVLERFGLLWPRMFHRMTPEAKEAVACLYYGLSDSPTASECRAALEKIAEENKEHHSFSTSFHISDKFGFGKSFNSTGFSKTALLGPIAMRRMGGAAVGPMVQLLRAYRYDPGDKTVPILFAAQTQNDPELFDELVRLYAVTGTSSLAVWGNRNENVVPLFETQFYHGTLANLFPQMFFGRLSREDVWMMKMIETCAYYNPLIEPFLRGQIEQKISKANNDRYVIYHVLQRYVQSRLQFTDIDREELLQWARSVSGDDTDVAVFRARQNEVNYPHLKGELWRLFRQNSADRAEQVKWMQIVTYERITEWLKNYPGKNVIDFFATAIDNDTARANAILLVQSLFFKEFFNDPAESAKTLQDAWADPEMKRIVLAALSRQFVEDLRIQLDWNRRQMEELQRTGAYREQPTNIAAETGAVRVRIPGIYGTYDDFDENRMKEMPLQYSTALYTIFQELSEVDQEELCIRIAREISSQDSPEVLQLLQKWSESDNPRLKQAASETLQGAQLREKIRAESRSLFLDLATGKIQPDDLLPVVPTWIWEDGKYVLQ